MWNLLTGLATGGLSLLGGMFSSDTSANNTQANIAAQAQAQDKTMAFNSGEADKSREFNSEEAAISRSFNSDEAAKAREFSSNQAAIQRSFQSDSIEQMEEFQTSMSNSAYQRSRADMIKAGLNPILAATAGGSSTPMGGSASGAMGSGPAASGGAASGGSASVGTPNMAFHDAKHPLAGIGDAASKVVNSAISARTFDKMAEEISSLQVQQAKTAAETETEKNRPDLLRATTAHSGADYRRLEALMPKFTQEGRTAKSLENIPDWLRNSIDIGGYSGGKVSDTLAPLLNSARTASSFANRFHW